MLESTLTFCIIIIRSIANTFHPAPARVLSIETVNLCPAAVIITLAWSSFLVLVLGAFFSRGGIGKLVKNCVAIQRTALL